MWLQPVLGQVHAGQSEGWGGCRDGGSSMEWETVEVFQFRERRMTERGRTERDEMTVYPQIMFYVFDSAVWKPVQHSTVLVREDAELQFTFVGSLKRFGALLKVHKMGSLMLRYFSDTC